MKSFNIQGDLRNLEFIKTLFKKKTEIFNTPFFLKNILSTKNYNDDAKLITKQLLNGPADIETHSTSMNPKIIK